MFIKLSSLSALRLRPLKTQSRGAIERASKTIRNIRWFEVIETRGHVEDGKVHHFQVKLKVGFTLDSE